MNSLWGRAEIHFLTELDDMLRLLGICPNIANLDAHIIHIALRIM